MRILLGMSGGVDSTYSALKLIKEGHEVEGCVLVMHDYTDTDAAKKAATELGIPLHVIDCREDFDKTIKPYFVNEYLRARTPNPCVVCNPEIKFKHLLAFARTNGFDKIATGHYARIAVSEQDGVPRYAIAVAKDLSKDQSYMLSRLSEEILSALVLPLAEVAKEEIRRDAAENNLSSSKARDSQEICFIPDGDYAAYIESISGKSKKGSFIFEDGRVLGEHNGIIRYTVGQRKGLGIALGARAFVTDINPIENTVTLSLAPRTSTVVHVENTICTGAYGTKTGESRRVLVKLRYLAPRVWATAVFGENGELTLTLDEPVRSVTPGQSAVLYDSDTVLASGFISSAK